MNYNKQQTENFKKKALLTTYKMAEAKIIKNSVLLLLALILLI